MSVCFHPERERKKVFSRVVGGLHRKRKQQILCKFKVFTDCDLTDSCSVCLFLFITRRPCPSKFGGLCYVIIWGSPRQHSCEWVVHGCSSETQSSGRLYIAFYVRFAYSWRQNKQAQNFYSLILLFENFREAPVNQCDIWLVIYWSCSSLLAHQMTNSTTRFTPTTAQVFHTVFGMRCDGVYPVTKQSWHRWTGRVLIFFSWLFFLFSVNPVNV